MVIIGIPWDTATRGNCLVAQDCNRLGSKAGLSPRAPKVGNSHQRVGGIIKREGEEGGEAVRARHGEVVDIGITNDMVLEPTVSWEGREGSREPSGRARRLGTYRPAYIDHAGGAEGATQSRSRACLPALHHHSAVLVLIFFGVRSPSPTIHRTAEELGGPEVRLRCDACLGLGLAWV
jgi:hypothetical protein